ncbi:AAA domain-containing protein [Catellatospora sichuanensis]|uniref:AAA domain-containing protein n=1 Tax=Catellatospora sichuanensis TaxID=1969805 RepID=UPI001C91CFD8|nr:AAA domain-containing protein [Catellatospora sichuanensis]
MNETDHEQAIDIVDPMVDRAVRLFTFLGAAAGLKNTPIRSVDSYQSSLWLGTLPVHHGVRVAHRNGDPMPEAPLLTLDRVPRPAPPSVPAELAPWLNGPIDDAQRPPALRDTVTVPADSPTVPEDFTAPGEPDPDDEPEAEPGTLRSVHLQLNELPDVRADLDAWLTRWQDWADTERRDEHVREFYRKLFTMHVAASGNPEELELVLGVACLGWLPPNGHPAVKRHLLTVPAVIRLNDDTGRLTVERAETGDTLRVEVDMLDPSLVNARNLNEVRARAQQAEEHPLHCDAVGALARSLVHTMDPDAEYDDGDEQPAVGARAAAAFAPALILRKRSQQGIVDIFRTIVEQLSAAATVPDGVLPLVDPDHRPAVTADRQDGAVIQIDDEHFLPLPVNDVQRRIISHVDSRAQTLVQGPPGTGKTHTAAALLAHLLAQGKRVLVTAHTDRALREVRNKLPAAFKPLSVSVVGTSREDMADLKVAVERIAATAADHDPQRSAGAIAGHLADIDELRRRRAAVHRQLIDARAHDVAEYDLDGYRGTQAAIAQQHYAQAAAHNWLTEYAQVGTQTPVPLTGDEITAWHAMLRDAALTADEPASHRRLPDLATIPTPDAFAQLIADEAGARARYGHHDRHRTHPGYAVVGRLPDGSRREFQRVLRELADRLEELSRRTETWMPQALADVRSGRGAIWQARADTIQQLVDTAAAPLAALGHLTQVTVTAADPGPLEPLARALAGYVSGDRTIKTSADGTPKLGILAPQLLKQAQPLFDQVRVNGIAPTTATQLQAFLLWAQAHRAVTALDRAWPSDTVIPDEDTLAERLQWHHTELEQLRKAQALGAALDAEDRRFAQAQLPRPDWNDITSLREYAALADAATAADALSAASAPLSRLDVAVYEVAQWEDAADIARLTLQAVRDRDVNSYGSAHARLTRLTEVRESCARRDALSARLEQAAPDLHRAITAEPGEQAWPQRLATFGQAWAWARAQAWLREHDNTDVNALQADIHRIEQRIHHTVEQLAAERAWSHAVSPGRLTGRSRANLEHYAYLVRRLGKGTGNYAPQQRAEIRQAMDKCRPSVPVWIMPIYRIAEQLEIHPDMFDVVVVDEASQASLEATFLQYLAPKIVVIGDDKQISPSAVGVDQAALRALAGQYIHDDPYRSSWQDPQRSLFDEARMRFSGLLTLVEHRRCVPEIIGFSNRIAYEPDGIRLQPVRQYGADRLEPIKPVLVPDGYVRGTTNKVNPAEADAIVDQIEKCIADPRYDGLTFGVISLLGKAQAAAIEKQLLERIPPAEWAARDLRCGDSADFQGSERDVVFLSMVAAIEPGRTLISLTRDDYVKRYNVAASRAKDQMWLFHSVRLSDVGNPEDMRFQLLDYCYGVAGRASSAMPAAICGGAPHDRRVEPFDSLFEQRVYNRLVDRGYTVLPQYQVDSYRIDLVVVGGKARLAVECDGDAWHGPDAYERDLARQRNLERCGWRFFRIRESAFYVDEPAALADLWATLRELDIHPSGWTSAAEEPIGDQTAAGLADPSPTATGTHDAEVIEAEKPDALPAEPGIGDASPPDTGRQETSALDTTPVMAAVPGTFLLGTVPATTPMTDTQVLDAVTTIEIDLGPEVEAVLLETTQADPEPDPAMVAPVAEQPSTLPAYHEFLGSVRSPVDASKQDLIDGIVAIVTAEGPVLGDRIHTAYVRSSGGQRVGKSIASALNSAITLAVRRGTLVEENPLREAGNKPRTYRLASQPSVQVRRLGPRALDDVPPAEVAALLETVAATHGWDNAEILFRVTLETLGLKRLTKNVGDRLTRCMLLTRRSS